MELILQNYQSSYFTDNSDVVATPPILSSLLGKLGSLSLLPMFGNELNAASGDKRQMVIMTEASQQFRVEFPSNAIMFYGVGGQSDAFIAKVENVMKALQSIFPEKRATRLGIVNTSFYRDTESKYKELYQKVFTYHGADPFEWDNRIVEHVHLETVNEKVNSGSAVRRCKIQAPFVNNNNLTDVINFEVDTNTIATNNSLRFDLANAPEVLRELYRNNEAMLSNLSRYMVN